ncbi:hypothetical protein KR074_003178, partial [Drosophila pseudoananassae]
LKDGFTFKTSICDGKNGGLLPMFGTCKAYYVCVDGKAVIGSCDEDMLFNPSTLHCDDARKVDCVFDAKQIEKEDSSSSESDEDDDYDEEVTPPPATTTSTKRPKQQRPLNKNTGLSDISNRICAGKKDGVMLSKKNSCGEYFVCKSRKPQLRSCPDQQQFSPTRRRCMKASEAKCVVSGQDRLDGPPITGGLCAEEKENSLAAHQSDCGKFLLCSNMMFLVMDCPTGLHFNVASSRCDYPKIAQCQAKNVKKVTKSNKKSKQSGRKPKSRYL